MTVSSQIIEVLNDLCRKFGVAIDWTEENIFPYLQTLAQKFIQWEIATSTMWIVIGVVAILLGILMSVLDVKLELTGGLFVVFGVLIVTAGIAVIGLQVYDIITCKFLPEKEIIEYVNNLLKSS